MLFWGPRPRVQVAGKLSHAAADDDEDLSLVLMVLMYTVKCKKCAPLMVAVHIYTQWNCIDVCAVLQLLGLCGVDDRWYSFVTTNAPR